MCKGEEREGMVVTSPRPPLAGLSSSRSRLCSCTSFTGDGREEDGVIEDDL